MQQRGSSYPFSFFFHVIFIFSGAEYQNLVPNHLLHIFLIDGIQIILLYHELYENYWLAKRYDLSTIIALSQAKYIFVTLFVLLRFKV